MNTHTHTALNTTKVVISQPLVFPQIFFPSLKFAIGMNDLLHTYVIYVIQCCSFVYSKKEFYYMNKFLCSPPHPSIAALLLGW